MKIAGNGEILVRGLTRCLGYVDKTGIHQPFDADGWLSTKDTGFFDEDGYLHVIGRIDNMFISGGENIQPEEIEHYLYQLGPSKEMMDAHQNNILLISIFLMCN